MSNKALARAVTIVLVGLMVIDTIASGMVLSILWEIFMVPKFGLPRLSIGEAIIVMIIIQFITRHATTKYKIKDKDAIDIIVDALFSAIVNPILTLASALLVMWFIQN